MNKIKVKDEVILITGKDKGSIGTVTKITDNKVVVEGLNLAKKHVKSNPNAGVTGGIIDTEMPVAVSNVAIYNAKTKKADRVGLRTDKDGNKERFFKSNGDSIV
ncbi:LSU ribosomal protein L24p (L26e) [uncultured Gammaproteobacteria bacterium]|jgi:large subunit ribosomal protein L24|uniref:Large ribosomal subunit protein uL24 n=3 Tax=sulfur-oxidizing symbionts TaxID=32036 RepID=A0A1H6LTW1_9GAMM|nr:MULTISPECIES: 50S ribosomal protein L24 [sulfur-oxidizing symbionts]CAC9487473.1 LSU ribosomal protein L24p (L26e) [uncultured Gammaproteobacteria bacterium]CAB5505183.1 LSU ribosomal protein L24p (L26e) [Bathymodiolus azoricus thioautotrophic gill symbiont]CAB5507696.1 LSU ribosomal protein L24p (L26e) [Bathymodiolus thermophilus thioautotrophic gill symbiont]CAC9493241.1 LSU ribosomal protein L24p (L26e) [uncultured Gammaproteobacteria bacterium]CAC9986112.1 LSU ribosomal protein L24p (L2